MKSCPTCHAAYPANVAFCPHDGTPLVEAGEWAEGTVIRGKYRILAKVGHGGMGTVYKALHLSFHNIRALKVMSVELASDPSFVKRFMQEAVITWKLQHPNAVRVDDIDEAEDGRPFIVMEFIEGRSLRKVIEEEGPLPVPRVCRIAKQVAAALDAAHWLGLIHRDIKPDNIVLVETPQGEQAKVLDFGIAKVKEARLSAGTALTKPGVLIGTPPYMSPEQAIGKAGDELDGRADIYSLGVVTYQMLTDRLPVEADTTLELLLGLMHEPPIPIRVRRPDLEIPEPVANVVMRCLEKKRELRPPTAQALIEDLNRAESVGAGLPIPSGLAPGRQVTTPAAKPELQPPEAPSPPPRPAPIQIGAGPRPVPASAPKVERVAKPSPPVRFRAGRWVAALIVLVLLGIGAWYFSTRPTGTVRENAKDGLKYVWIPPGAFQMGCSPGDSECAADEKPSHRVRISKGFWMGQTEVTVGAYKRFSSQTGHEMPAAPTFNSGWDNDAQPIVNTSWDDAQAYCKWAGGRLPTEAEWEYAARGGSTEARYGPIDEVAWYNGNSGGGAHEVGQKRANSFGLFDMLGNVWEWVNDWYDDNYYRSSPDHDPSGPATGQFRVLRGGSWGDDERYACVSIRNSNTPVVRYLNGGCRCVWEVSAH